MLIEQTTTAVEIDLTLPACLFSGQLYTNWLIKACQVGQCYGQSSPSICNM